MKVILGIMALSGIVTLLGIVAFGSVAHVNAAGKLADSKAPVMKYDTKPGPSFQTIEGKLNKIDGNIYVMEDYTGKEMRLYVGKDTKKLKGDKKPGDIMRAEITKGRYANSIQ